MTKEEALAKIEELKKYVDGTDEHGLMEVGFKHDEIFLLSVEEYEEYKDMINRFSPTFKCWWWLRSSGGNQHFAANVYDDGSVNYDGHGVDYDDECVRPAIKFFCKSSLYRVGEQMSIKGYPFRIIDVDTINKTILAVAEVPICTHRFDKESNNYEESEIRRNLLAWYAGSYNF